MNQPFDKLFVLWREPGKRRYVVGTLARDGNGYVFRYDDDLAVAKDAGFRELVGFPPACPEFRSPYLFATFNHRVPSPRRPDFQEMVEQWGVLDRDDQLEILARSGGIQLFDNIELSEWRDPERDDLSAPLSFRIAGARYYDDPDASRLSPGTPIQLHREPANQHDGNAVQVFADAVKIGYVPRQYSRLFSRLIDSGVSVSAEIERRIPESEGDETPSWIIRAQARNQPFP